MILALRAGFRNLTQVSTQSCDEKPDATQFIVKAYTHVEFEGIARYAFGPGEKNLAKRSRKIVKNSENGSEIEQAYIWNQ